MIFGQEFQVLYTERFGEINKNAIAPSRKEKNAITVYGSYLFFVD